MDFNVEFEAVNRELQVGFEDITVIREDQPALQEKTIAPTTQTVIVEPDIDFQGLSKVTVEPIQTEEITITANGEHLPSVDKYFSKVTVNVQGGGGGEQPTLFTPTIEITIDDRLIITDGNGDFATYEINVQGATSNFTFETNSKNISLKQVQGLTHNETQTVSVTAKGENFNDSETVTAEWIFVEFTQGMAYTLNADGQSYTLTGKGEATTTDIVIPDTHEGLPVTAIGTQAFYNDATLTSVVMNENITIINQSAFYRCMALKSVIFKEGLLSIENNAFGYTALENITLPASLQTTKANCFSYISTFQEVVFRGTPVTLDRNTFTYNRYVYSIKVPWSEGAIPNAAWGATQAVVTYDYVE